MHRLLVAFHGATESNVNACLMGPCPFSRGGVGFPSSGRGWADRQGTALRQRVAVNVLRYPREANAKGNAGKLRCTGVAQAVISIGKKVVLHGLTSDAGRSLNGQEGRVVEPGFIAETQRWAVQLDGKQSIKVKEGNLRLVTVRLRGSARHIVFCGFRCILLPGVLLCSLLFHCVSFFALRRGLQW